MTISANLVARKKLGNGYINIVDITFDDSYPAGGEPLVADTVHLNVLEQLIVPGAAGYMFEYNYSTQKLLAFEQSMQQLIESFGGKDIKGSVNTDSENADSAALPINGALVAAATAFADGAWVTPELTNPDIGRNLCVAITNDSGGPLNLFEGASKVTITGTWRGAAQTEDITITSTAENKAVATGKFRYKYGVKPFDTVTTVVIDNEHADGLKMSIGIGSKVGLPTDLLTPAVADVLKITKNAADLATAGIVDVTNMTVNLGTLADNNDFNINYRVAGQVTNASNLASLTVRAQAVGY